jgi:1-aminocyclopropane-1-carboxylate deaminase/D-cysteine desulfhydrase-like pyridoxal-dependent ACC family enzyme
VRGVNVFDPDRRRIEATARDLLDETASHLGLDPAPPDALHIDHAQLGAGYGVPTEAGVAAIRLLARLEGLVLDPVYTGKAMAGLIAAVEAGEHDRDEALVFLHTGGVPAVFAYAERLQGGG